MSALRNNPGTFSRLLIIGAIKGGTLSLLSPESKLNSPGTHPFPLVFLTLLLNPAMHHLTQPYIFRNQEAQIYRLNSLDLYIIF